MPKNEKLTVAVTGAAGLVGTKLIAALDADERVGRILGFDLRPPARSSSKLIFDSVDVRDPALESRFSGVDVVVHLAFIMDPIRDESEMRDVNVNGTQNVLRSAGKAGVKKVVYTSSAITYGAHPDNDVPLTEESPLRANLDFSYSAHKLETEYVVREFRDEYPDVKVVVYRPAIVFDSSVDNAWSHLLEYPVLFTIQGHEPPLQFVHDDDVARALVFAVFADLDGAYNLCPRDWLEFGEILSIVGKRRIDLPEPFAFSLIDKMWSTGMAEAPAGFMHYLMYPWVMTPDKLEAAGFTCEHSSYDAFMAALENTRRRVRFGKATVRRSDLKRGALVAGGLLLAGAATRAVRRARA